MTVGYSGTPLPRKLGAKPGQRWLFWIAWPKRASRVTTDLDENVVRDQALAVGLVDVKVAAIDATWSGLKLVRRLRDRQPAPTQQGGAHG